MHKNRERNYVITRPVVRLFRDKTAPNRQRSVTMGNVKHPRVFREIHGDGSRRNKSRKRLPVPGFSNLEN